MGDRQGARRKIMVRPISTQRRHRLLRCALVSVSVLVGALAFSAAAAQAALPPRGASFSFHDHDTAGKNWHVELKVDAKNPKRIATLVVYSQLCKGTVAKTGVPISDAGVIAASGGLKGYGSWEVNATFNAPRTLVGMIRVRRANCDTGVLSYPNAITGDGHTDHAHGGGGHHGRQFPDFGSASIRERKQARGLHKRVLKRWTGITPAQARRRGFHRPRDAGPVVQYMFHVYNRRYERDDRVFDAKRPESLMFWRRTDGGPPVLLAPMFRVAPGKRPSFAGPIPIYHGHGDGKSSRMTHVWMTKDPISAWAGCLPVNELQLYNPAFKSRPGANFENVGAPCPAPA